MGRRLLGFGIVLLFAVAPAAAAERWLHVHVVEHGDSGDTVRVNVPLSTVESLVPLIQTEELSGGRLRLGEHDVEGVDLRAMWKALRSSGDTDFLTVDGTRGRVRVSRKGPYLLATVEGGRDDLQNVKVRVPVAVLDALFSSGENEIDVLAALRALGDEGDGELVRVESDDSQVRVWIDGVQEGRP
ncbi:MAG TPA: hypothetical protein VFV75_10320 [Candidatus Polarisedimenticolaceae bacterium]|nr:hypothetical protein [Candidatus Polarisedimenticolaceae bacterium]